MSGINNVRYIESGLCSFCEKEKEGFVVSMDGKDIVLCRADFMRMAKMRTQRQETFIPDNGHEQLA